MLKINETKKGCRDGFGQGLLELGKLNKSVVALCADLADSTMMNKFRDNYPTRYFDVGVAEQNLVTAGSGLAHLGKIPFVSGFGAFCPGRCWEQIRTTICYNNNNVKIIATHTGLNVGEDGATHQVLEDIGIMRTLPNMIVIQPIDFEQARKATIEMSEIDKPVYMRVGRYKTPQITNEKTPFKIGKAQNLKEGKDIAIIGCGPLTIDALKVAYEIKGVSVKVINMHTIKPIDKNAIIKASKECKAIITIEDHQTTAGLGSAVCEVLSQNNPTPVFMMGVDDKFGESGIDKELFNKHGLNEKGIKKMILKVMKKIK